MTNPMAKRTWIPAAALLAAGCSGDATAPEPSAGRPDTPPSPANRAPAASGAIPDQRLSGPGEYKAVDVAAYFSDPDGDTLAYTSASSDTSVVAASTAGSSRVHLAAQAVGNAAVTVTASDPDGQEAQATFAVAVVPPDRVKMARTHLREDSSGLSLALPEGFGEPSAMELSAPAVVAASIADGWLGLAPLGRGTATVTVTRTAGSPAVAEVSVRPAVGTFGVDFLVEPSMPPYFDSATAAMLGWWEETLDSTEWPDVALSDTQCQPDPGGWPWRARADELVFMLRWPAPGDDGSSADLLCNRSFGEIRIRQYNKGHTHTENGVTTARRWSDYSTPHARFCLSHYLLVHEFGHLLGLVLPSSRATMTEVGGQRYFTGPLAVRAFRETGGSTDLPGVPMVGTHWRSSQETSEQDMAYDFMSGKGCPVKVVEGNVLGAVAPVSAVSLAFLEDIGWYVVDHARAMPYRELGEWRFLEPM